jgi:RNA polymerase sigma-70 factor (ECF subfamily)
VIEPTTSDRQVIDAVLAGDREAFRVLVDRESRQVIGVCRRVLGDPAEAEDAAQDTFTKAYEALATYRGDGPFGAWLRRIALRVAIARLATRRQASRLDDELVDPRVARLASGEDPEARYLGLEHRADVVDAIAALPPAQRDVVLLRFYDDLTLQDIARITDNPIGTVKSRLSRGIATLRQQLGARSWQ